MLLYLVNRSRWLVLGGALASVLAGTCSVLLVTHINAAIAAGPELRGEMSRRFATAVLGALVFGLSSNILFQRLRQRVIADLRLWIAERVMNAPLRKLERLGSSSVQSAMADHVSDIAHFFVSLPTVLTNTVIVAGCLFYLASLSSYVFVAGAIVIALGAVGYSIAYAKAMRHLQIASKVQDSLFGYFRSLTDGGKELRQNRRKRNQFADRVLGSTVEHIRRERVQGMSLFEAAVGWGNFLVYALIGCVIFVFSEGGPASGSGAAQVMTGFALVLVFMVSPLQGLLDSLPIANSARVASQSIDELMLALASPERIADATHAPLLQSVEMRGLKHRYYHEQSDEFFELGPIDLKFGPGEVVFLVGGNGSGKTTLAKLLVGLYPPEDGTLHFNGTAVGDLNRDAYRQLFSTIFSDFHLFDRLLETGRPDLDKDGNRFLEKLHLQHKVRMRDGAFTTRELSQGQRKRLALVVTYLEDRPFLVFDEWAADQDPVFKRFFYLEVLPELRALGKAVLVISHDDRFFHVADRVVRLENGKVVAVEVSHMRAVRMTRSGTAPGGDPGAGRHGDALQGPLPAGAFNGVVS